jgi:hypothetical protein
MQLSTPQFFKKELNKIKISLITLGVNAILTPKIKKRVK